jgi:hypothetical protein
VPVQRVEQDGAVAARHPGQRHGEFVDGQRDRAFDQARRQIHDVEDHGDVDVSLRVVEATAWAC